MISTGEDALVALHKILPQVSNSSLKSVQILPGSSVQMHPTA